MKIRRLCTIIILFVLLLPPSVYALDVQYSEADKVGKQVEKYTNPGFEQIVPNFNPKSIISDAVGGKFKFDISGIINRVIAYIFKEVYQNIDVLLKLVLLVLLSAVLKNLRTAFLEGGASELAFYVCYIVTVSVLVVGFSTVIELGQDIIDGMVNFMYATLPVLIGLLMTGGNLVSGSVFSPLLLTVVNISATIVRNVFIPLMFLYAMLCSVDNISEKIKVSKLASLIKTITLWGMGTSLTVFIAIVSLQGSFGAVIDGVTSKTTKYMISALVPVAGKYLADAADSVIGCTLLIKNGAGLLAMVGILAVCLVPILKMLALVLLYKAACAITEPISEGRMTKCINDVAGAMTLVVAAVSSVAFMFFICIAVIIGAGNVSAMIR